MRESRAADRDSSALIERHALRTALAVTMIVGVAQGCADSGPPVRPTFETYYRFGPILPAEPQRHQLPIEAVKTAIQAGAAVEVVSRDVRVKEVFLVCWPEGDWPAEVFPAVSVHPIGEPADHGIALTARAVHKDRAHYDVPDAAVIPADGAVVDLGSGTVGGCPAILFGVRGEVDRTPEPEKPEAPDEAKPEEAKPEAVDTAEPVHPEASAAPKPDDANPDAAKPDTTDAPKRDDG